jgi:hypothetical protein
VTALTIPNRRRSLFGAFRGASGDTVAASAEPVALAAGADIEMAIVPATDITEPAIETIAAAAVDESAPAFDPENAATLAPETAKPAKVSPSRKKAQLRVVPSKASSHPTSGRRGDLFVDSFGRLWFCQAGGKAATWKKVKLV